MNKACTNLQPFASDAFEQCGNIALLNMQAPTMAQLRVAIEALTKLGERLNIEAAYSIAQLPETSLGSYYAGNIGGKTMEQTSCIETVTAQLKNWHDELSEQRRSVFDPGTHAAVDKRRSDDKNAVKNKWREIKKRFQKSCHEVKGSFQQPSLGSSIS